LPFCQHVHRLSDIVSEILEVYFPNEITSQMGFGEDFSPGLDVAPKHQGRQEHCGYEVAGDLLTGWHKNRSKKIIALFRLHRPDSGFDGLKKPILFGPTQKKERTMWGWKSGGAPRFAQSGCVRVI
jgi:hypothetical protein